MIRFLIILALCCINLLQSQTIFNSSGIFTGTTQNTPLVIDFSSTTSWIQPFNSTDTPLTLIQRDNIAHINCTLTNRTPASVNGLPQPTFQALRTTATTSIVYLPKVSNVGKVTIEGYVGSAASSFSIQKWNGTVWVNVSTKIFPNPTWGDVELNININEPVQLRYIQSTANFNSIRKITVSEYVNIPTIISGQTFTEPQVFENLNDLTIENCIFKDMTAATALLINGCSNVIVRNCTIENITSPTASGKAFRINNFSNVLIDDVTIKKHRSPDGHSSALNIDGATSHNITVQNCKIFDVDGGGIVTEATSDESLLTHDKPIPGVKILNNLIYDTGLAPDPSGEQNSPKHGMYIKAVDALIEGNRVYNCYDGQCISVRSTGIVRGNTCYNGRTGAINYWPQKPAGSSGKLIVENNVCYQTQNIISVNDTRPISTNVRVLAINPVGTGSTKRFDDFIVRFNTVVMYSGVTTTTTLPVVFVGDSYTGLELYGNHIIDLRTVANTPKYISHYFSSTAANSLAKNTSNFTAANLNSFADGANFDFRLSSTSGALNFANSETDFPSSDIAGNMRLAGSLAAGAYNNTSVLSTNDFDIQNDLVVYPNPSNGIFTIKTTEENLPFEVFDLTGRSVYKNKTQQNTTTVNLSNYAKGVYIIKFNNNKSSKLIIE